MYYKDIDELIVEHFRLQKDINDIQSQIRKLEKTNQILDQQNRKLKLELESKNLKTISDENNSTGLNKLLDKNYLVQTLNKASEICEVATGEIIKHAKYVTSNIIQNLNSVSTVDTSMLYNFNNNPAISVNTNLLTNVNSTLVTYANTSILNNVRSNPIQNFNNKVSNMKNNILSNINTYRQDTYRESTSKETLFGVDSFNDTEKTNSILDSTIISNLSSNESILLSDEEYTQIRHTGQYQ